MITIRHRQTRQFIDGQSHGQYQELGRIGEISNIFDILPTCHDKLVDYNRPHIDSVNVTPDP